MMDTWKAEERCSPDAMTAYAEAACIGGHSAALMGTVTMTIGRRQSLTTKYIWRSRHGHGGVIGRRSRRIGAGAVRFIRSVVVSIS